MLVILLNCVTLGMFHPCEDINCDSERCKILQVRLILGCIIHGFRGGTNDAVTAGYVKTMSITTAMLCYEMLIPFVSMCVCVFLPSLFITSLWLH